MDWFIPKEHMCYKGDDPQPYPFLYFSNKDLGISFIEIGYEFRAFGWQSGRDGSDKCIFILNIAIVFKFLMQGDK